MVVRLDLGGRWTALKAPARARARAGDAGLSTIPPPVFRSLQGRGVEVLEAEAKALPLKRGGGRVFLLR